jgi:phosphoserine phosphatase
MNYKPYTEKDWSFIESQLKLAKASSTSQHQKIIAAFDADGTLWDCDVGENFFQYQIDQKKVTLPPSPFEYYKKLKQKNPETAFMWLAQINKGVPYTETQSWGKSAYTSIIPNPVFDQQKKLINYLQQNDVEIFVVTASVKVAVEYGASLFGIDADHVLGVQTKIENGIITDQPLFPVTYKQGKVDALLQKTEGQLPFICSGNTMGDFELLNIATQIRLAVSAASADDPIYRTEMELQSIAKKNNWLAHRFI